MEETRSAQTEAGMPREPLSEPAAGAADRAPETGEDAGAARDRQEKMHRDVREFLEEFPVVPREGVVRAKLVEDGNLVTAQSDAFREFAAATARRVGLDCPETVFDAVAGKTFSEQICTLHFPPKARVYLGPSIPRAF